MTDLGGSRMRLEEMVEKQYLNRYSYKFPKSEERQKCS